MESLKSEEKGVSVHSPQYVKADKYFKHLFSLNDSGNKIHHELRMKQESSVYDLERFCKIQHQLSKKETIIFYSGYNQLNQLFHKTNIRKEEMQTRECLTFSNSTIEFA